jgi:hypothetical protein
VSRAMRRRVSEREVVRRIWGAGRLTGCDRWSAEGERRYTDHTA